LSNFKRDVGDSVRMVLVGLQGGAYAVIDNEGIPTEVLQPYARPSRNRKDPRARKSYACPFRVDPFFPLA
jgi:hypothetical protein